MRNTVTNRVINFVKNVDEWVWITAAAVCVIVFVIWLFALGVIAVSNLLNDLDNDRNARQKVYIEAIVDVKRDCRLLEKIIRPQSVTYTYSCDGVEYQFDETL